MNISELTLQIKNPPIYTDGTDFMWTHPHISKQLLAVHLSPDTDLASRRQSTIKSTISWIASHIEKSNAKILDLGCGPGLYCEELTKKGYIVSGVDISKGSISYAKEAAAKKSMKIDYLCCDYTEINFKDEQFDLVIMIFTDFGVLSPDVQRALLSKVYQWLKPGGKFIFDIMGISGYKKTIALKSWECEESGFWRDGSYLHLSETIPYEKEKVILSQHIVVDNEILPSIYRFWTQYFSKEKIESLFESQSYSKIEIFESILPDSDFYDGKDIYFVSAGKQ